MSSVKISRKKILQEPDEFLSGSQQIWLWVHENRDRALMIVGGLVAVVLIAVAVKGSFERSREQRAAAVGAAVARYGKSTGGTVTAELQKEFATLADRYAGSAEGVVARYYQAGSLAASGEAEKARQIYAALALPGAKSGDIALMSRLALAYLDLAGGATDAALKAFQDLLATQGVAVPRAQIMLEIAGIHEKQGRIAEARRVYQDLLAAHPDGSWAAAAKDRLRQLAGLNPTAS